MVRAEQQCSARLPLEEVDMLTIEELLDAGVVLLDEQIDFFHHPERRLAVVVYGVPDPDRLYIAGPDSEATIYQQAREGEPADEHGMQAVVLPIVMQGGDQEELASIFNDYIGDGEENFPVVYGSPCYAEFMYAWTTDEVPIYVAPWDLWPITADEVHHWAGAADNAYWHSKLHQQFELLENYNGSEYYGDDVEDLRNQSYAITDELRRLERDYEGRPEQDQRLVELAEKYDEITKEIEQRGAAYVERLEKEIIHPDTGYIDAQMPPVVLPPEQAAIWRSLQSLSWRNWSTLEKEDPTGGNALYGSRFVQANRRLCPWY